MRSRKSSTVVELRNPVGNKIEVVLLVLGSHTLLEQLVVRKALATKQLPKAAQRRSDISVIGE